MGPKKLTGLASKGNIPVPLDRETKRKAGLGKKYECEASCSTVITVNGCTNVKRHLSQMNRKELTEICKKLGVKAKGKNNDILAKLLDEPNLESVLKLPCSSRMPPHSTLPSSSRMPPDSTLPAEDQQQEVLAKESKLPCPTKLTKGSHGNMGVIYELPQALAEKSGVLTLNIPKTFSALNMVVVPQSPPESINLNNTFTMSNSKNTDHELRRLSSGAVYFKFDADNDENRQPQGWCVIDNCIKKTPMYQLVLQSGRVLILLNDNHHIPLLLKASGCTPVGQEDNMICEDCLKRNEVMRNRPNINQTAEQMKKRESIYALKEDNEYARRIDRILDTTLRGSEEERRLLFFAKSSKIAKSPALNVGERNG